MTADLARPDPDRMMRGIWFTFLPLLAAAALSLWGGEQLARRGGDPHPGGPRALA